MHETLAVGNFNLDEEQSRTLAALTSSDCLSFYMPPDLSDVKQEQEELERKQQLEKANILREILSSEKKYISDLREIVEVIHF